MDIAIQDGTFNLVPIPGEEPGTMAGFYFRFTDPRSGINLVAPIPFDQAVGLGQALVKAGEEFTAGPVAGGATPASGIVEATERDLKIVKDNIPAPGA